MQEFDFYAPETLDALCRILTETGGRVIAGGTDVIPRMRRDQFQADRLVDISRIADLRFITEEDKEIRIGALTTYADMLSSSLLQRAAPSLLQAAATVGSPQIRHRGTLGGSIATASPAGDTLPPLLTLNAEVRLISLDSERTLPLAELLRAPGETCLESDEIVHSVAFPRLPEPSAAAFLKLGKRKGMAISVVSVAVALVIAPDGDIAEARIAFGSVAPTAVRSPHAEAALAGQSPNPEVIQRAAKAATSDISPIGDVRATADYRRHAAVHLLRRALQAASEKVERKTTA